MSSLGRRLDPFHRQVEVAEERRVAPERVDGRADVVHEPRKRQLSGANTTADGLLRLVDGDLPARARHRDRGGKPVRAGADHDGAPHARSERSAGPNACPPWSTGSNRSPCFSIRASASRIPKSRGRTFSPSSSQRRGVGHRRARLRPHRVSRGDRLSVPVLTVVDQHAAALLLEPLGRHEAWVLRLEPTRHALGQLVGLGERVAARDRDEDVDSVGAARLHVRAQLERVERFPDEVRDANRLHEAVPRLRRVEVEDDVVRPVRLVDARIPGVHVDAVHLHHPDDRCRLVDDGEIDEPRLAFALARPGAELPGREPVRLALRRLLVEVRLAADAVRVALQRERAVLQVRDDRRPDLGVVLGEVLLRDPVAREQDLVRAGQAHPAPADLELVAHAASLVQVRSCFNGSRYGPASSGRTRSKSASRSFGEARRARWSSNRA